MDNNGVGSMKRSMKRNSETKGNETSKRRRGESLRASSLDDFFPWLLGVGADEFYTTYFEKKPLLKSHGSSEHFTSGIGSPHGIRADWSTERMLQIAESAELHYTTDVNVVRLDPEMKKRVPFKTEGVVTRSEMQKCMSDGWSVRFLRPHQHASANSAFIRHMEEVFECYCGLNSYWTPASNQGFAPHYDDVDVFLIQLEGKKRWRLYTPPDDVDILSRHSSEDYNPDELPKPFMTMVLTPGDVLYMPRGCIHQGNSLPDAHSLHITFSANQMNAWADYMLCATKYAIETLSANDIAWRRTIPRTLRRVIGSAYEPSFRTASALDALSKEEQIHRSKMQRRVRELATELSVVLADERKIDVYVDQYAIQVMERCQPPPRMQKVIASERSGAKHCPSTTQSEELNPGKRVCIVSRDAIRLDLATPGEARVYHIGENTTTCMLGVLGLLRFEADFAPAIATLVSIFPESIRVDKLPFPAFESAEDVCENQQILCESLRDAGVLRVI